MSALDNIDVMLGNFPENGFVNHPDNVEDKVDSVKIAIL